jgi:hypothetical protein
MGAYDQPTQTCPYCGEEMECDWVDIGVGCVQCGPYHCDNCGASEMGPEDVLDDVTDEECKTGYYKGGRNSPYANQVGGLLVDHKTALGLYRWGLLDPKPCDGERGDSEQAEAPSGSDEDAAPE